MIRYISLSAYRLITGVALVVSAGAQFGWSYRSVLASFRPILRSPQDFPGWSRFSPFVQILFVTIVSFNQSYQFNFPLTLLSIWRKTLSMPAIRYGRRSASFLVSLDRFRFALSKDTNFSITPIFRMRVLIGLDDIALYMNKCRWL